MAARNQKQPNPEQKAKEKPPVGMEEKKIPDTDVKPKELPKTGNPENTVIIGGQLIEIKPTKLKYQRNRTAAFYKILEVYPLTDI